MSYIPPEQIARARAMDLLTYLQTYDPQELVHFSANTYCTRTHDSLKISNGKWYWFSRGFGGTSALDYLVQVQGMSLPHAVETILGQNAIPVPAAHSPPREPKTLKLPEACPSYDRVMTYLTGRGLDRELLNSCVRQGLLYESLPYHNAVFVGRDRYGKPRYAHLRSTTGSFKGETYGSDKRYSFRLPAEDSGTVHLFESAIDLLSYATLERMAGRDCRKDHLLSLAGIYRPREGEPHSRIPLALTQYLKDYPCIRQIVLRLDNDPAGRAAAKALEDALSERYEVLTELPMQGKDYNDWLCVQKGLRPQPRQTRPRER